MSYDATGDDAPADAGTAGWVARTLHRAAQIRQIFGPVRISACRGYFACRSRFVTVFVVVLVGRDDRTDPWQALFAAVPAD